MAKAAKKTAPKKAASKSAAPKKAPAKAAAKAPAKAAKEAAAKKGRTANAAFMAPLKLSAELAKVVGKDSMPRTEIIKKIWDYIKKNDLQDSKNRRMINADDKLRGIFAKDQISMFELAKIVNNHVS